MSRRHGVPRDGLRHAGVARRGRGLLHAHPPGPAARSRTWSPSWSDRYAGHRRHRRRCGRSPTPRPPRSATALGDGLDRRPGQQARGAVHRGRRRRARRRRRRPHRRRRAGAALQPRLGGRVRRPARAASAAAPASAPRPPSSSGPTSPEWLDFQAAAVAEASPACRRAPRCSSPPTRCPSGCWSDDPYPDQLRGLGRGDRRDGPGSTAGRAGRSPGSPPGAPPTRGGAPTSSR